MSFNSQQQPFPAEELHSAFEYSPALRYVVWRNPSPHSAYVAGEACGYARPNGQTFTRHRGKQINTRKLAYFLQTGVWPSLGVWCIDGNPFNMSINNMALKLGRRATPEQVAKVQQARQEGRLTILSWPRRRRYRLILKACGYDNGKIDALSDDDLCRLALPYT